jgi:putative ABC transport system permease protein
VVGVAAAGFRGVSLDARPKLFLPVTMKKQISPTWRPLVIVNETLVRRFFPQEDPVGARVGTGDGIGNPHLVVGVVKDERVFGLTSKPEPVVYVPIAQGWFKGSNTSYPLSIAVRTQGDPLALAKTVQREIRTVDPEMAFANVRPMERLVEGSLLSERLGSFMLGSFSLIALILAALGIYGVMANAVSQRTNEIGIRMALGAQISDVLRLVLGRGMVLTGLGLGIGLAGALAFTRVLKSFLHGISPTDPWTFAIIVFFLAVVSALACYLPARRAARINPMVALRQE